jgi:hypothetical protein
MPSPFFVLLGPGKVLTAVMVFSSHCKATIWTIVRECVRCQCRASRLDLSNIKTIVSFWSGESCNHNIIIL